MINKTISQTEPLPKQKRFVWAWLGAYVVMLGLLAGCTAAATAPSDEPDSVSNDNNSPALKAAPTQESGSQASSGFAEQPVLVYERSGGLKGTGPNVTEWQLFADGRITSSDGRSWQVEPETIQKFIDDITSGDFQKLESSYIPKDTCCDRVNHVLTLRIDNKNKTVTTLDEADMPQFLVDTLQKVNTFLLDLPTE